MSQIASSIIEICRDKLLSMKQELLIRANTARQEYLSRDMGRDEVDMSLHNLAENEFLTAQHRIRQQLLEIEQALARIERGTFGICEETEEIIEEERLLAIPWTRLSIEGAEIQEAIRRKYAR